MLTQRGSIRSRRYKELHDQYLKLFEEELSGKKLRAVVRWNVCAVT